MGLTKRYQTGAAPPGSIRPHHNTTAPTGWALCDGSSVARGASTDALFNSLVVTRTATSNGTTTLTLSSSLSGLRAGCRIEGANISSGTTVVSSNGTTVVMSQASVGSGTFTVTFLPHGAPDNSNFYLPRMLGRVPFVSATKLNERAGYGTVVLDATFLPSHTHAFSDPGHYHSVASWGVHRHHINGSPFAAPTAAVNPYIGSGSTANAYHPSFGQMTGGFSQTLWHTISTTNPMPATTSSTGTSTVADANIQPTRCVTYIIRTAP